IASQVRVLRSVYQFKIGDVTAALETASQAIRLEAGDAPLGPSGAYCIGAQCVLGSALYFAGRSREAEDAYRKAVHLAEMVGDHRARIYALGYLAMIAAEDGRLDEARAQILQVTGGARYAEAGHFDDGDQFVRLMVSLATAIVRT